MSYFGPEVIHHSIVIVRCRAQERAPYTGVRASISSVKLQKKLLTNRPACVLRWVALLFSDDAGNSVIEYCNGETFEPRCHGSDVIVMLGALYGRMKLGRCVKRDPGFESMLQDPLYLGCSANVLDIVSRVCSGQRECSLRVLDQNFHNLQPCYDSLKMHLEAAYTCFNGKRRTPS